MCDSEKPNFEELTLMIRATRSRSRRPNLMEKQKHKQNLLRPVNSGWVVASPIASATRSFFEIPTSPVPDRFGSVLGPQNRPKTVPKRGPKRVLRPASFCNRFSTDFRSSETRKSFKNLRKIDDFATLGVAVPTPKNVDVGRHFGTRNASKIVQNGCPKTDRK